jgi:hypothetical protein
LKVQIIEVWASPHNWNSEVEERGAQKDEGEGCNPQPIVAFLTQQDEGEDGDEKLLIHNFPKKKTS